MPGRILVWFGLCALIPSMTLAQGRPAPPPETVEHLHRHHHAGDWWRITTDSARYEARVSIIDERGLAGLTTARKTPPAPDRIHWESIARIDARKTHKTRGRVRGLLLGMCAGFVPLANGNANSSQPRIYMVVGGAAGYILGGMIGAADVHEEPLYVAPIPPSTPVAEAAPPERSSVVPLRDSLVSVTGASTPPARPSFSPAETRAIAKACNRISPARLLQIQGGFGTFHGYAASIGPEGLGGLRVEPTRPSVPSPGSLTWNRVDRINVYGNNAGRGAVMGAVTLGGFGLLLGFPIAGLAAENSDASQAGIIAGCAAVGAGIGLVLGAGAGAMTSGWHHVFP